MTNSICDYLKRQPCWENDNMLQSMSEDKQLKDHHSRTGTAKISSCLFLRLNLQHPSRSTIVTRHYLLSVWHLPPCRLFASTNSLQRHRLASSFYSFSIYSCMGQSLILNPVSLFPLRFQYSAINSDERIHASHSRRFPTFLQLRSGQHSTGPRSQLSKTPQPQIVNSQFNFPTSMYVPTAQPSTIRL